MTLNDPALVAPSIGNAPLGGADQESLGDSLFLTVRARRGSGLVRVMVCVDRRSATRR